MKKVLISLGVAIFAGFFLTTCDDGGGGGGDAQGDGIIGGTVVLTRLTITDEETGMGFVTVPFTALDTQLVILNVNSDLNGDGTFGAYPVDGESQEEWLVQNTAVLVTETEYSVYFPFVDTTISSGVVVEVIIALSETPVPDDFDWDNDVPPDGIVEDRMVAVSVVDTESLANPEPGFVGAGGSDFQGAAAAGREEPIGDDLNLETLFYRPGVPDAPQGANTCAPHSFANSIAWMAQKHSFTDKLVDQDGDPIDVGEVVDGIPEGVIKLGFDILNVYGKTDEGDEPIVGEDGESVNGTYNPLSGISPADAIIKGKDIYVFNRDLPIESSEIGGADGTGTFDAIKEALKDGCDVEVVMDVFKPDGELDGGHMVTVVGFADVIIGNEPHRTLVFHDPNTNQSFNDLYELMDDEITFDNFPFKGGLRTAKLRIAIKEAFVQPQPPGVSIEETEQDCGDGIDNDGDGQTDCADTQDCERKACSIHGREGGVCVGGQCRSPQEDGGSESE